MTERCKKLLADMAREGMEAAWIVKPENIRYLTGYTGEGCLLLAADASVILTDFRYLEQVGRQAPESLCVRTTRQAEAPALMPGLLSERGVRILAYEPDCVTVQDFEDMRRALPGVELVPLKGLPEALRMVKDEEELACVRRAAKIACDAFEVMLGRIKPGMTEKQVQVELDYQMLQLGSEKVGFDTIACAGVNGSLPHAIPSDHVLKKGELLTMDFGAQVNGYKSDMTRTVAIGPVVGELKAIYDTVYEAQCLAFAAIRPGVCCREVDKVARDFIDRRYPGAFGHSLGHGVGLLIHEAPNFSTTCDAVLRPGHVMTVEPGVYIEGLGGCRIEDMALITDGGYEDPVTAPKHLITL